MNTISTINVPFHGNNLCIVNHDGRPYVPMKPIVEGMGLSWEPQLRKLNQRFAKGMIKMVIPSIGGAQETVCLAMHKLTGWLFSIMPNKVKPEIRDKVIQYQEECDDVLYEYWTTGEVKAKPRKQVKQIAGRISSEQQEAIKQLVLNRGKALPKEKQAKAMITMWSSLKSHFGCTYKEIDSDKFTEALSLAARVPLEGEYLPKQAELPTPKLEIDYPLTWYPDNFPFVDMCFYKNGQLKVTQSMLTETKSPSKEILSKLESAGYDVTAAKAEIESLRHTMIEMSWALGQIASFAKMKDVVNKTFTA
ncbi:MULTISPECIES: phage antirepressor N-terminal domain-containing protein [Providencia]|uniref:phage antirepressor N-terminal domain-containing protein n=2 Tax=Morganellaceae TaxID=1903414 RepID=UPI002480B7D5|nr:phage antirepressor N-terminal domain-containing protein [Providencia rettgeri]MDU7495874.1 phage antirepressor N-terminal domain-containing protein [Providencia rettgeri]HEM8307000.1 phage antirepressor N-terminal domain-containing protein [Providencia rettgeri]